MAICTGDNNVQMIERTECIGNSLVKINSNFTNLDIATCELSNKLSEYILNNPNTSLSVADSPTIDLTYGTTNRVLSANIKGKIPNANGGAGTLTGILQAKSGVVSVAVAGTDFPASSSVNAKIDKPSSALPYQVLTYNGTTNTWVASAIISDTIHAPTSAAAFQVLTYNGTTGTWVASATDSYKIDTVTGMLKSQGDGKVYKATPDVDYASVSAINNKISLPASASSFQVLTYNGSTGTWVASATNSLVGLISSASAFGAVNGIVKSNGEGIAMAAVPDVDYATPSSVASLGTKLSSSAILKPSPALPYQILTYNGATSTWVASGINPLPASAAAYQVLTYNGATNTWVASAATNGDVDPYIPLPPTPSIVGKVLTWNGTEWFAGDPSGGGVSDTVPVGSVMYFAANEAPIGYLECDGSAVSRAYYSDLDEAIFCGSSVNAIAGFGYRCTSQTNPTGTRNATGQYIVLPDLRGEFIRGWDNGRNIDTGRAFGSTQTDDFKAHAHAFNSYAGQTTTGTGGNGWFGNATRATNTEGGTETRPRNVALLPCIKVLKVAAPAVVDFIPKPTTAEDGYTLTYQGITNSWVASPWLDGITATNGQLLVYKTNKWIASSTIEKSITVTGDISATGDIVSFSLSDERLKNNVTVISDALEKVSAIRGVEYTWNTELQSTHSGEDVGVIAQEIEQVLPQAVATRAGDEGYKAVRYEKIVPLLIEAIKDLKKEIDALKQQG